MYDGKEDYYDRAIQYLRARTKSLFYLQEKYPVDALLLVHTELDRVSHYYWGSNEEPSEQILAFYREIDFCLGETLELTDSDTIVIVASDHGFGNCSKNLNIHFLLEQHGLLSTCFIQESKSDSVASDQLVGQDGAPGWFSTPPVFSRTVDWAKTRVYMPTPGSFGLNINMQNRERHGIVADADRDKIESKLRVLCDSFVDEDGNPYFSLQPRHEIYTGIKAEFAPDYLLYPNRWDIMPHTAMEPQLWASPSQEGIHRKDGILFSNIQLTSDYIDAVRIEDVTPTILDLLDFHIPLGLSGSSLKVNPSVPSEEAIDVGATGESLTNVEKIAIKKTLHDLGYL
jgi:predicted AlkP superfamily phosphohydrolase/phosphomutase